MYSCIKDDICRKHTTTFRPCMYISLVVNGNLRSEGTVFGWAWPILNYKSVLKLTDLFVYARSYAQ